jgi:hypothetical protein
MADRAWSVVLRMEPVRDSEVSFGSFASFFDSLPVTSGLPSEADIAIGSRHVRFVRRSQEGLSNAHTYRLRDRRCYRSRRAQRHRMETGSARLHNLNVLSAGVVLGVLGTYIAAWIYGYRRVA